MNAALCSRELSGTPPAVIQQEVEGLIDELVVSWPDPGTLTAERRRGIISRYTAVLEGNFIYWMTAAYLAAKTESARTILQDNLLEEVRDCHPAMLRRFALAAGAFPRVSDVLAVERELTQVRLFLGCLSSVRIILMMAFFEGFIQRFMMFLAQLAEMQGSEEQEYTSVHGVCDVAHTQELFRALAHETALDHDDSPADLFEGVMLLRDLIERIIRPQEAIS